ncbi:L-asparaginase/GlutRNAGln amidotransferase subunit D [Thermanaerovibrio velox DSM 12556]|uniref:L-asparaginase/GlutRNAGln amidotransferase subunit D n=1 Tax=Thermanaerovibrio velox DSM 12556 TaxID=926567 RepID=H0US11_9BACT|nr:asparaginase [Thermanaerovibrio velox]EHM10100.1 L-asparaginase/GlutRNAGln amidotransferase subunit D [Thermanaerovibrio velox DSM 12556]
MNTIKPRVRIILTGGTIGSDRKQGGSAPSKEASRFLSETLSSLFSDKGVIPDFSYPWGEGGIDSSDLSPSGWLRITRDVAEALSSGCSGVLILHGTDTMAYTAAWLSLCFAGCPIPIILTGSQFTRDYMPEDGSVNLKGAVQVMCSNVKGVWIYFNWKLIQGNRAHKARASHPDAFSAMGGFPVFFNPEWGLIGGADSPRGAMIWTPGEALNALMGIPENLADLVCSNIRWIFSAPGAGHSLDGDEKLIGIIGYGAGNAPQTLHSAIDSSYAHRSDKPVIVACSQAEGDMKNPLLYDNVGLGWLSQRGFRVFSQMDYPIEFVHALACYSLLLSHVGMDGEALMGRYLRKY